MKAHTHRASKTDIWNVGQNAKCGSILTLLVGVKKNPPILGKILKLKTNHAATYGTTIPYLGVYTREIKTCSQKTCIRTFTIPQNIHNFIKKRELAQGDFNREMGSEAYLYNRVWPSKK